ncbi:thymidylate kinase [Desulfacinum hydrothermale DSM 13146]|uniref:Thymidylate kinase n=1 Tax=Desulfacinum hydrothermale DSM 13146 TaxID=1121390 RepID=A0A1W1XEF9_9BACT|nr:dTMP kinase [Desulfacinum hydrothermale]SMC22260.1 thymidylate kinase [Desulfacinum hydrothermale DSM 13146]
MIQAGESNGDKPLFLSVEGIDGSGKTTVVDFAVRWLEERHIPCRRVREPGTTKVGEQLRSILLDSRQKAIHPWTEVLLYLASQNQQAHEVIRPALEDGTWVVADRFVDATLAYQGWGRGLDMGAIEAVQWKILEGFRPHKTLLLDCPVEVALQRRLGRSGTPDRLEAESTAFHQRVRQGYLALARREPDRFLVLDASKPLHQVLNHVQRTLEGMGTGRKP